MTGYQVIVADPPWPGKRGSGYRWRTGRPSGHRRELDYPTLSVAEITALPVETLAASDARLFLWTTQRFLRAAFTVAEAWGFSYSCSLVWCKAPHGWGPGGAFQGTVEFVIYARRGTPDRIAQVDRQWWTWPRGRHSAKPEEFLAMVESFPGPRLELFARRRRPGWDAWGNEVESDVELAA